MTQQKKLMTYPTAKALCLLLRQHLCVTITCRIVFQVRIRTSSIMSDDSGYAKVQECRNTNFIRRIVLQIKMVLLIPNPELRTRIVPIMKFGFETLYEEVLFKTT